MIGKNYSKKNLKFYLKIFLIIVLLFGVYYNFDSFSNEVNLVAIYQGEALENEIGILVPLKLEVKRGSGKVFTNLNSLKDIDTQNSILNSQKTACINFNLNCWAYDFYFEFNQRANFLKGNSASSSVAYLVYKTIKKEKIDNNFIATGSLGVQGLIGQVGETQKKIEVGIQNNKTKILIPKNSKYNLSKNYSIEIFETLDLDEMVEILDNKKRDENLDNIDISIRKEYEDNMLKLSKTLCDRKNSFLEKVEPFEFNSTRFHLMKNVNETENKINENISDYTKSSYCFFQNINLRNIFELQKNKSFTQIKLEIFLLEEEISKKETQMRSQDYRKTIKTKDDFYIYLISLNRLNEAKIQIERLMNEFSKNYNREEVISKYSFIGERFETILYWEDVKTNLGKEFIYEEYKIKNACFRLTHEASLKNIILNSYNISLFNQKMNNQDRIQKEDEYLCVYNGLQINSEMDTILGPMNMNISNIESYRNSLLEKTRIKISQKINEENNIPIISNMYYEYSKDFQNESQNSIYYSNLALGFLNMEYYFENQSLFSFLLRDILTSLNTYIFIVVAILFV